MLPNNCDIVIVMALWAGRRLKDMDKMKQVDPEVLSQPELLVSCFWGEESALQGFNLFYGESGTLSNDSGIETFFL